MRIEIIKSQIECNAPIGEIRENLKLYYLFEDKKAWELAKQDEYNSLFLTTEDEDYMSYNEWLDLQIAYTQISTVDRVESYVETIVLPVVVTMRQARLALHQSGLLATIESAISGGTDEEMKIEWEYATELRRDWSSLIALTTQLGMTSKQLDDLFILAGSL